MIPANRAKPRRGAFEKKSSPPRRRANRARKRENLGSRAHAPGLIHSRFQCLFIAPLKFAFMSSYALYPRVCPSGGRGTALYIRCPKTMPILTAAARAPTEVHSAERERPFFARHPPRSRRRGRYFARWLLWAHYTRPALA